MISEFVGNKASSEVDIKYWSLWVRTVAEVCGYFAFVMMMTAREDVTKVVSCEDDGNDE